MDGIASCFRCVYLWEMGLAEVKLKGGWDTRYIRSTSNFQLRGGINR